MNDDNVRDLLAFFILHCVIGLHDGIYKQSPPPPFPFNTCFIPQSQAESLIDATPAYNISAAWRLAGILSSKDGQCVPK